MARTRDSRSSRIDARLRGRASFGVAAFVVLIATGLIAVYLSLDRPPPLPEAPETPFEGPVRDMPEPEPEPEPRAEPPLTASYVEDVQPVTARRGEEATPLRASENAYARYLAAGIAAEKSGDWQAAVEAFQAARDAKETDAVVKKLATARHSLFVSRANATQDLDRRMTLLRKALEYKRGPAAENRLSETYDEILGRLAEQERAMRAASLQEQNGAFDKAAEILSRAFALYPKNPKLRAARDRCKRKQVEEVQRRKEVARALKAAAVQEHKGEFEKAIASLAKAQSLDPQNPKVKAAVERCEKGYARALAEQRRREAEEARRREAVARALEVAAAHEQRGEFQKAINALAPALPLDPQNPKLKTALERCRKKQAEAIAEQRRLQREAQVLKIAAIHEQNGAFGQAIQALSVALELDPRNAKLKAALERSSKRRAEALAEQRRREMESRALKAASIHEQNGAFDKAVDTLSGALTRDAENPKLLTALDRCRKKQAALLKAQRRRKASDRALKAAAAQEQKGAFDKAIEILSAALPADPQNAELSAGLGRCKKRQAEALAERRRREARALEIAAIHEQNGALPQAIDVLSAALALDPQNPKLLAALERCEKRRAQALAEQRRGQAEEARRRTQIARALEAAAAHEEKGEFQKAIETLTAAVPLDPKNPKLKAALGRCRAKQTALLSEKRRQARESQALKQAAAYVGDGALNEAIEVLSVALLADPQNPNLKDALDRCKQKQKALAEQRRRGRRIARALAGASAHERKGELKEAIAMLSDALPLDPRNAEVEAALARCRKKQAETLAERRRSERETRALKLASMHAENGAFDKAIGVLSAALLADPQNPNLKDALARCRQKQKALAERLRLEAADARRQKEIAGLLAAASVHEQKGEFGKATEMVSAAFALNPSSAKLKAALLEQRRRELEARALKLAAVHEANGEFGRSIKALSAALLRDPQSGKLRAALEGCRKKQEALEQQRRREAEEASRKERIRSALTTAAVQEQRGEFKGAVATLFVALPLEPRNAELNRALERCRKKQAAALAEERRRKREAHALKRASAHAGDGALDKAIEVLSAALLADPQNPNLKTALERCRKKQAEAIAEQRRLRREAQVLKIAAIHERNSAFDQAIEALSVALELDPQNAKLKAALQRSGERRAEALAGQRRGEMAARALEAASMHERNGAFDQAVKTLLTALSQDPRNVKLEAALAQCRKKQAGALAEQRRREEAARRREEIGRALKVAADHEKKSEFPEAIAVLSAARSRYRKDAALNSALARCKKKQAETDAATRRDQAYAERLEAGREAEKSGDWAAATQAFRAAAAIKETAAVGERLVIAQHNLFLAKAEAEKDLGKKIALLKRALEYRKTPAAERLLAKSEGSRLLAQRKAQRDKLMADGNRFLEEGDLKNGRAAFMAVLKIPGCEQDQEALAGLRSLRESKKGLFPAYGVTLGKTTVAELASLGKRPAKRSGITGERPEYYLVRGMKFWYGGGNTAQSVYLTDMDELPKKWVGLGLRWDVSYNELLGVLRRLGFTVEVADAPHVAVSEGSKSFRAKLVASKRGRVPLRIAFAFGSGAGTTADSKGTLYSMTIRAR